MSGIGRARWIFFGATELSSSEAELGDVNGLRPNIFRRPTEHRPVTVSKWELLFLPMWQQLPAGGRPDIGRNTADTRAGNRTPCDRRPGCLRALNNDRPVLVRCNTDLGAELFRSSYLTLSVHHYGCTEETSNGTARTRTGSSKVPVKPGPAAMLKAAERERRSARRRERRWWVREWIQHRPLFGQYETLIKELEAEHADDFKAFLRMEPNMYYELLNSVGARPVSVKDTSSSGCLRCTGHRPILGRAPADVFSDVVTMGLRRGGSVRARWNLVLKLKFHRAATDAVLSNKRHGCRVRWKSHLLAHRNLIGRAMWLGHYVAPVLFIVIKHTSLQICNR